jgi:hypothetical protein
MQLNIFGNYFQSIHLVIVLIVIIIFFKRFIITKSIIRINDDFFDVIIVAL